MNGGYFIDGVPYMDCKITGDPVRNVSMEATSVIGTRAVNAKINQIVHGNTNSVYINPLNSLRFVLNKIKKDKINLKKDFYIFTGSTVGVVPI